MHIQKLLTDEAQIYKFNGIHLFFTRQSEPIHFWSQKWKNKTSYNTLLSKGTLFLHTVKANILYHVHTSVIKIHICKGWMYNSSVYMTSACHCSMNWTDNIYFIFLQLIFYSFLHFIPSNVCQLTVIRICNSWTSILNLVPIWKTFHIQLPSLQDELKTKPLNMCFYLNLHMSSIEHSQSHLNLLVNYFP